MTQSLGDAFVDGFIEGYQSVKPAEYPDTISRSVHRNGAALYQWGRACGAAHAQEAQHAPVQ